jgi:hypothetical protein
MSNTLRYREMWVALVLLLAAPPTTTFAQDRDQEAAEHFRRGVAAARNEQWVAARRAFERAYELLPRTEILINLAAAQAQTEQLVEAQRAYRTLLDTPNVDARFREEAERALLEIDREIPRVRVSIEGLAPGDRVALDDEAIEPSALDGEISVNPGPHTLVVTHGETILGRADFAAERGRSVAVPMTLDRPDRDETPAPLELEATAPDPTPQLAVGAILTAVGLGFGVVDIVSAALEGSCADSAAGACTEVWALDEGPMIGYAIAGAASLVTGIVLLVWGATMTGSRERTSARRGPVFYF